jgi:hypothetical protein
MRVAHRPQLFLSRMQQSEAQAIHQIACSQAQQDPLSSHSENKIRFQVCLKPWKLETKS